MQKAMKNMRKINFKKVVAQKFKEYDQKLEALTSINVSKVIDKVVHAKVLTKMKKLLPTHVLNSVANYVKPGLNNSIREVMRNNHIRLFTKPSTSADDLSEMVLKLKLLNRIHLNKSNTTHPTHQKLYDTLYESINLDQEALDAQDVEPSFHKRYHVYQDPPNDHERENMKKKRKNVGEPSSRSSRKEKSLVERPNAGWLTKKSGSANAKRRTTWFDFLLKSEIDQNENHILGPSIVAIAKKLKELIQKDVLKIANLEGPGLEKLTQQYKNDVEHEYHVDQLKVVVLTKAQWNSGEGDVSKPRSFESHMRAQNLILAFSTITSITWSSVRRSDKKEYTFSYADLPRLNLNDIEDMYMLKVQDKLHHLQSKFEKDFNNTLLLFIRRTVILNRVEDL
ncbi:hypothetical protein Tco_0626896 [Tanacetum coccineum]|uniref:Uncharacterized protein n=1 Tax=Tanacetum coccineum TaxID=301880 RepID=A0ABQ4WKZ5_9ASTR